MSSVLICPLGTTPDGRTDLLSALASEIKTVTPDLVVFLVSKESRNNATLIAREAGLQEGAFECVELDIVHDLNEVFQTINETLRGLRERGFAGSNVSVNYTSGTKVMGTAAVLAAIFNRCREARYIYHEPGAANRTVITNLESMSAYRDMMLARRLIEETRYRSAADLLGRIDRSFLSTYDVTSLESFQRVAAAYYSWDSFDYKGFVDNIVRVPRNHEPAAMFLVDEAVVALLQELARHTERGKISHLSLADMVNNAVRRMFDGRFDDAVARLYRALEMLAQWVLLQQGIDTDDVDTRRVPPRDRVSFEAMRSMEDGQVRIGMRKAYELLLAIGHPLGQRYHDHAELAQLIGKRRTSILAHGTRPISREVCCKLYEATVNLVADEITEFDDICRKLQFPWFTTSELVAAVSRA